MIPNSDFTKFNLKFNILGSQRDEFISFLKTIKFTNDILSESSSVVILTDEAEDIDSSGKLIAFPYYKGFDKSKVKCEKIMTYAIDANGADVVGKNVRFKSDFTAFELLSDFGIGRVYLDGTEKNYPKYALALACGLMLSGVDFRTAVNIVSSR